MNDDDKYGADRHGPEEAAGPAPLSRGPIRLRETTTDDDLDREASDRFFALLEMLGLSPTPEGLRDLLFHLLIQKGAPLTPSVPTPFDETPFLARFRRSTSNIFDLDTHGPSCVRSGNDDARGATS
jgi:hypothetical protein